MDKFYLTEEGERIKKFDYITDSDGETVVVPTKEWKEYKQRKDFEDKLKIQGIRVDSWGLDFDDYIGEDENGNIPKLRMYVDEFEAKFRSIHLYLWSRKNGTQKSTIASIIAKHLIRKKFDARFTLMSNLLNMLEREKFDPTLTKKLDGYRNCDFLVIDDSFDKHKVTVYKSGYQLPFLDTFLRNRLEIQGLATCFTSNCPPEEISNAGFDTHMESLVVRSTEALEFTDDYTKKDDFKDSVFDKKEPDNNC